MANNKLVDLFQSTVALHDRFKTSQTVQQSLERFTEEYNETLNEIPGGNLDRISEEFVDALVTAIGVLLSIYKSDNNFQNFQALFMLIKGLYELYLVIRKAGLNSSQLDNPIDKVITKNDYKTLETHTLDRSTGKITRKVIQ